MPAGRLDPVIRYLRTAARGTPALSDGQLLQRFAATRDEAAFAALVRRHGPMVLGVCRRVLGDWHAADDAFQATFLVLARKAGALADPELLPRWLHGVACRTAARARAEAARRRARESQAAPRRPVDPDDALVWRDLRPVLDEEIGRLPPRHRDAVVLCYLEGRTNAEAAHRLGCSRGTVATLLARARERLRGRLTRRGLALPAALAATLGAQARAAGVSATLESFTVKAAVLFAAGKGGAAELVATPAACLAEGVIKAMLMKKCTILAAVFLVLALAGAGAGLAAYRAGAEEPAAAEAPVAPRGPVLQAAPAPVDPRPATGKYRTANFEVTAPTRAAAEQIARWAERSRKEQALLWLGQELPPWPEPCPVRVRVTEREAGHATSFVFDRGTVLRQEMILEGPVETILADLLPHEVTHTVLAHWARRPIPRWADEGAAALSESATSRARHERVLRELLDGKRLLPLRRLLAMREYGPDVKALLVQGSSLTDFLVRSASRGDFLAFVAEGDRGSWDKAVAAHYGYSSVEELEAAWLAEVRKRPAHAHASAPKRPPVRAVTPPAAREERPVDVTDRPQPAPRQERPSGRLPAGPAPMQILVTLRDDGRLTVWREAVAYVPRTTVNAQGQPVTSYRALSTTAPEQYDLADVRVQDTKGREIGRKELTGLLKGEMVALATGDGRPVDPLHLRLVKEGTLVFVLPAPLAAWPPSSVATPLPPAPVIVPPPLNRGTAYLHD